MPKYIENVKEVRALKVKEIIHHEEHKAYSKVVFEDSLHPPIPMSHTQILKQKINIGDYYIDSGGHGRFYPADFFEENYSLIS